MSLSGWLLLSLCVVAAFALTLPVARRVRVGAGILHFSLVTLVAYFLFWVISAAISPATRADPFLLVGYIISFLSVTTVSLAVTVIGRWALRV